MCGRFTHRHSWQEVREMFNMIRPEDRGKNTPPRTNIAPTQDVLWVAQVAGQQRLFEGRWGLVPFWAKDNKSLPLMINARSESLTTKGVFKTPLKSHRCLIPADGYYEWTKGEDGGKDPWYLTLPEGRPFAFAGLWADNNILGIQSCTIITAPAAKQIAEIHDRMPVILERSAFDDWLSPDTAPDDAVRLLDRNLGSELSAHRVSRAVNKNTATGPELVEPI